MTPPSSSSLRQTQQMNMCGQIQNEGLSFSFFWLHFVGQNTNIHNIAYWYILSDRILRRAKNYKFSQDELQLLSPVYLQLPELHLLAAIAVPEVEAVFSHRLEAVKRCFRTVSSITHHAPWQNAACVVEYKSPIDQAGYALITGIYRHRPLVHIECPDIDVFKVLILPWSRGEFLDCVRLPAGAASMSGDAFLPCDWITPTTICLMPATLADATKGFTHNALHII